jgi:hypothetical protein
VLGIKSAGSLKLRPSSPPVRSDSCEASVWNAAATASVIMAKKMARTRSENKPTASESTNDTASDAPSPTASASQVAPMRVLEMARP